MTDVGASTVPPDRQGDRRTIRQRAASRIRTSILTGEYKQGKPLKEESLVRDLLKEMRCSRTSVREALLTLAAEGFVRLTAQTSVVVTAIEPWEVREIFAITLVLETLAARGLVGQKNPDIGEVETIQGRMREFVEDETDQGTVTFVDHDVDFHCAIAHCAGMPNAAETIRRMRNLTRLQVTLAEITPELRRAVLGEHEVLLDALRSRDLRRVEDAVRMHLVNRADRWFQRHRDYLQELVIFERSAGVPGPD